MNKDQTKEYKELVKVGISMEDYLTFDKMKQDIRKGISVRTLSVNKQELFWRELERRRILLHTTGYGS